MKLFGIHVINLVSGEVQIVFLTDQGTIAFALALGEARVLAEILAAKTTEKRVNVRSFN